jgi:hypothetical protein
MSVVLRYDLKNPKKISIVDDKSWDRACDVKRVESGGGTQTEISIAACGIKAVGTILFLQPTGNIISGCEEMALQVKVTRPNGKTYETTINKAVSKSDLPSVQPNSVVEVFYTVENEEDIVILLRPAAALE